MECVTQNINQKKEKPKVKILIAFALFAASIVGALAQTHVHGYYRTDGTYVQPHWRSSPNNTTYGQLVRSWQRESIHGPSWNTQRWRHSSLSWLPLQRSVEQRSPRV